MDNLTHIPLLLFALSFVTLSAVAGAGSWLRVHYPNETDKYNEPGEDGKGVDSSAYCR